MGSVASRKMTNMTLNPNQLQQLNIHTQSRKMNGTGLSQKIILNNNCDFDSKTNALTKASLFKSRTLLNDQKRRSASQLSKKLIKIAPNEVQLQAVIGEGEFGTVYKGTYNGKQVAIKKLKDCTATSDFMREADIMGTLNNPCILKIFGLVQDKNSPLMMVQELMVGSILEKLWQSPNEVNENHLKLWSSQIALGMLHMEEQKIVHRDLAARNVLLASMSQIKISDFGLSRSTDDGNAYTQKTEGKIPIKWYAPESIEHLKFTSKSDVWSYGVTLWEMFSYGEPPYGAMNGSEVYNYIQSRNRLQKPTSCPKNTYRVMLQCWDWQEDLRPTFKELNLTFQNDSDYQKTLPVLKSFR
jgi:tyrosine-protein kinase